jgi:ectoine hydroxylase-related dioxygenase (phytanoyl-CoA dioxygenase family)
MPTLSVDRVDGDFPLARARALFEEFGVVVLKNIMSAASQSELRALLERKLEAARASGGVARADQYPKADFLLGDILAVRELEPYDNIFFSPEVIRVIKALLSTDELLYWGDSSIQYGEAARGFHKDNVDRLDGTQDDWIRPYELVRCGFYMQDHAKHSGGLKVRLRSHGYPTHRLGKIADVPTQYGDMVIWSMRLTHSGNNKRVRFGPRLALHPKIEGVLPAFLSTPEENRRIAAFCSFGKAGSHLDRYVACMNERDRDYRPYFLRARNREDAGQITAKHGVRFRLPNDFYGEFDLKQ